MSVQSGAAGWRGRVLHCLGDPAGDSGAVEHFEDGLLLVDDGRVAELGPADELLARLPADLPVNDHRGSLIVPGLIDCHVHFPQLEMIASYGEQLLDWLSRYAYPAERRYADADYAAEAAEFFLRQLLGNGTTTALVFATVHPQSVDAIFAAAARRNLRLISGKTLMDHGCPADLCDPADAGIADSRRLIERWHGHGRLGYAITPRFALTSSAAQLAAAGRLAAEFPDVHVHTHLAENRDEVGQVAARFPERQGYLDVYRHYGLLRERAVFAHCLHLDDSDRRALASHGGAIAFCPSSNLFLGSGLFDLAAARRHGIEVGIGSDIGAGTSLNLLETLAEAYKVLQLERQPLHPFQALYLATLGAARALRLDDRIGSFLPGREADFVVLDPAATEVAARRQRDAGGIEDVLFTLTMLGDDRAVAVTAVCGEPQHRRSAEQAAAGSPRR